MECAVIRTDIHDGHWPGKNLRLPMVELEKGGWEMRVHRDEGDGLFGWWGLFVVSGCLFTGLLVSEMVPNQTPIPMPDMRQTRQLTVELGPHETPTEAQACIESRKAVSKEFKDFIGLITVRCPQHGENTFFKTPRSLDRYDEKERGDD